MFAWVVPEESPVTGVSSLLLLFHFMKSLCTCRYFIIWREKKPAAELPTTEIQPSAESNCTDYSDTIYKGSAWVPANAGTHASGRAWQHFEL